MLLHLLLETSLSIGISYFMQSIWHHGPPATAFAKVTNKSLSAKPK